ncbi:MAG TPA: alpha/beta fold hydrolase [Candidatus Binataceae bacterium]|nr:alpha/beta fold hydrolase [Candidatus Binataceae bacterium]
MRILKAVCAIAFLILLIEAWRFASMQAGGPPHMDLELTGGIPATLYLPGSGNPFFALQPLPPDKRRPAVLLVHGFSSDRALMSVLARRIARNGYACLTIDLRGHGHNRNPFARNFGSETLRQDLTTAVNFLRTSSYVDGSRIVVIGHSMGANAALDYAAHDPNIKGSVMISGGFRLDGPDHPRNALFIFAQNDPEFIQDGSKQIAEILAGNGSIELGKVYGDAASGTALEAVRIPHTNHITITRSTVAAATILGWLDSIFGKQRSAPYRLENARLSAAAIGMLAFLIVLIGIGQIAGAIAPEQLRRPSGIMMWLGLPVIAIALLIVMPFMAVAEPAYFVSLIVGDDLFAWLGLAGGAMLALMAARSEIDWSGVTGGIGRTLLAAFVAFGAIYALQMPFGEVVHTLAPTPERLLATVAGTAIVLPFFFSFEWLLRRGGLLESTFACVIGRAVIIGMLIIGVSLRILPGVLMLTLSIMVFQFIAFEIFAVSTYSRSNNLLVIALVESAWFAWIAAIAMPITFMF